MSNYLNLYEELEENFKILENQLISKDQKIKKIIGDTFISYDKTVNNIVNKLKELGYKTLKFPFNKEFSANIIVYEGKRTALIKLVE